MYTCGAAAPVFHHIQPHIGRWKKMEHYGINIDRVERK